MTNYRPIIDGLRLGTLVELHGLAGREPDERDEQEAGDGMLGQLLSYFEETNQFSVVLLSGHAVYLEPRYVRAPQGLTRPGRGGDEDSFDYLVGGRTFQDFLGEEAAACLFEKGFCVLRTVQDPKEAEGLMAQARDEDGAAELFARLPEEVEEGYLGKGGRGLCGWMNQDDNSPHNVLLDESDDFLSFLAAAVQPFVEEMCGGVMLERTASLVSLALGSEEVDDYPSPEADNKVLGDYLGVWHRQILRAVHCLGPGSPLVELESSGSEQALSLPFPQESVTVRAAPGTLVLYRSSCFSCSVDAPSGTLSVSSVFLKPAPQYELSSLPSSPSAFMHLGPAPPPDKEVVNVTAIACRLAANFDDPEMYRAAAAMGCDAATEIPFSRFNYWDYWNADETQPLGPGQMSMRHMSFTEGLEYFDNKAFDISELEAASMDPMQRQVLEVGATLLQRIGVDKKGASKKSRCGGVSVGLDKDDWPFLVQGGAFGGVQADPRAQGGIGVQAIISNRLSFAFNLKGPNFVADTACSASLCATHFGKLMLEDRRWDPVEFHVALGIHQILAPHQFIGLSGGNMGNPIGRCLTFDQSARGYMKGEGCSGLILAHGDLPEERECVWRSSQVNQNGRSATLTAPNGIAQQEVITKALREAQMEPDESTVWDCHGTGTSLGDPIEVGSVKRVQAKCERPDVMLMSTNKPYIGHLEGGAAMTTLLVAVLQVKQSLCLPFIHFRVLNPHLDLVDFKTVLVNEFSTYNHRQGNNHVSSFGFGGTNGHAVLWGQNTFEADDVPKMFLKQLQLAQPPEVWARDKDDPATWDMQHPIHGDPDSHQRWSVSLDKDDPDSPAIWEKVEDSTTSEQTPSTVDDWYSISGSFNGFGEERMVPGSVPGLHTITLEVPESGLLDFRFIAGDSGSVLCPVEDRCTRKTAPMTGPAPGLTNVWVAQAHARSDLQIDLFALGSRRSVLWIQR